MIKYKGYKQKSKINKNENKNEKKYEQKEEIKKIETKLKKKIKVERKIQFFLEKTKILPFCLVVNFFFFSAL